MMLYCDNKPTINIPHNRVQRERTKHRDRLTLC